MFDRLPFRKEIAEYFRRINLRYFLLILAFCLMMAVLVYRLFGLQVIHGSEYLNSFQLKIRREVPENASRGNIYDRNGVLLAYNELAYSVVIRDVFEQSRTKDESLNRILSDTIRIIEENGDQVTRDFGIVYDASGGRYTFRYEGTQALRFLADIYGYVSVGELSPDERSSSAQDIIDLLCGRFHIGEYMDPADRKSFVPGLGYDPEMVLKLCTVRYLLSLNSFQKYMPAVIASDVSMQTVATVMEQSNVLQGVSIEEDTIRRYTDGKYFAPIIGYTGKVSPEELEQLQQVNPAYSASDIVGKSGIEASMEDRLQGTKGRDLVYVDNLGRVLEQSRLLAPVAGDNVYLTIDYNLQKAAYDLLEKYLSRILLEKIRPVREFLNDDDNQSDVIIPIYEVYYSVIRNNVIDISHFDRPDAGEAESAAGESFRTYQDDVFSRISRELTDLKTPYEKLSKEYQVYESYIVSNLYDEGILVRSSIDTTDQVYQDWTVNETISLREYLDHCLEQGWVDVSELDLEETYTDSETVRNALFSRIEENLRNNVGFSKRIFHYMILGDILSGEQICRILLEQGLVDVDEEELSRFSAGAENAYTFMLNRISDLDLTPAQLNLDPFSGSLVAADPNTGEVLALVSYPSYDNNYMSNGVDPVYYNKLLNDASSPLINYATYQQTAPGSTFKMVSATAGLMEGVITLYDDIYCSGTFDKIGDPKPHCWIWPNASHGHLNVTGAIENSCNLFFYEVGYRLGTTDGVYDPETGVQKLRKYASMYGLDVKSGIEIEEAAPHMTTEDAVRSAIGQASHNYTTVSLARYVSTVANGGTCYDLTLIDRITDSTGLLLTEKEPVIHNVINMNESYWSAIHTGMSRVIAGKPYFVGYGTDVAGKTGTAQQSTDRANHALFVCYAPASRPEITFACRIANGYTSDYAAQYTQAVMSYYLGKEELEDLMKGENINLYSASAAGD